MIYKAVAAVVIALVLMFAVLMYVQQNAPSRYIGIAAECKDGTYSASKTRSGTCSGHGGVKKWIE